MIQVNLEMPTCCYKCRMLFPGSWTFICCLTGMKPNDSEKREKRPEWCPLKEVKKNA